MASEPRRSSRTVVLTTTSRGAHRGAPAVFRPGGGAPPAAVETRPGDELRGFENAGEVAARAVGGAGGRAPARSPGRGGRAADRAGARAGLGGRRGRRARATRALVLGYEGDPDGLGGGAGGERRLLGPAA